MEEDSEILRLIRSRRRQQLLGEVIATALVVIVAFGIWLSQFALTGDPMCLIFHCDIPARMGE